MNTLTNGHPRPDRDEYVRNRSQIKPEDLLQYANQWIAWSLDGRCVVAHHEDLMVAAQQAQDAGLGDEDVNWEHIPEGGEIEILL